MKDNFKPHYDFNDLALYEDGGEFDYETMMLLGGEFEFDECYYQWLTDYHCCNKSICENYPDIKEVFLGIEG